MSFPKSVCIGNPSPTPVPRPTPVPKPTMVLMLYILHVDWMPLFMCPYIEKNVDVLGDGNCEFQVVVVHVSVDCEFQVVAVHVSVDCEL